MTSVFRALVLPAALLLSLGSSAAGEESIPGVDSHYETVEVSSGASLQTIVTAPEGDAAARYPLLFTQWVSCGSLAYREGSNSREILAALARESGLALVRVERSALLDGPACAELDFDTEFAHYVDAFTALLESPRIDSSRVFVYGSSLGSNTAALLARELGRRGHTLGGVIVSGGGGVTYLERMLAFEQRYLERRPGDVTPAARHREFLDRTRFNYEYLVNRRHPDAVAQDSDAMARVRNDILGMSATDHYGRPFAWHQQLAEKNFLAAWAEVDAPVLVIFNEFDQFESRHGHALIADTVNRLRPGTATFVERTGIGHSDNRYPSVESAYAFEDGEPAWRDSVDIMLRWLGERSPVRR